MKTINKYLIAISIIAIIACSGLATARYADDIIAKYENSKEKVHLDAKVTSTTLNGYTDPDNGEYVTKDIININFDKPNVYQDFFVTLQNTRFANSDETTKRNILQNIQEGLENTTNFTAKILKDNNGQLYVSATPIKAGVYDFEQRTGSYVIVGGTSGTKVYLTLKVQGTASLIPTVFKLNNIKDPQHFSSNVFTGALYIQPKDANGKNIVIGETPVSGNRPLKNEFINISVMNLDYNNDPVDNNFTIVTNNGTPEKNFDFNIAKVPKINEGRPGNYILTASYDGHDVYTNGSNSLEGSNPNLFKVDTLGHDATITGTTSTINTKLDYKVSDYWNNSVKNVEVAFRSSDKGIQYARTFDDGIVSFNYGCDFGVDAVLDYTKHFTITPVNVGVNDVRNLVDSIGFHRQASTDKSVCLQTMGKGLVTDKKTFNAPNGMSISAKGGIFGCIGLYKIQWFDSNKNLIKTEEWDNFKSWDKDERFFVPENAEYVKYQVGCKATGKAKPETDYLPAGNAIIFYEGAAGTENVHIAAQNANGYEILREDYNC